MHLTRITKTSQLVLILFCFLSSLFITACSRTEQKSPGLTDPKVTIYFTKASPDLGVILIPILRKVHKGKSAYETAVRELFLGPTLEEQEKLELRTEIPEGSRLIDIQEDSKQVQINISSQFMSGGGSESMQVRFRQLRETALNLAKGRPVYLYIDGQKAKTIGGEGLEVPQPLDSGH
jgi:spore germination protein GerM